MVSLATPRPLARSLRALTLLVAGALAALAGACGPGSTSGGDGGTTCTEAPVRNPGRLFGRCNSNADCEPGGRCLTATADGYPGGFCTRGCERSLDCEAGQPGVIGYCGMLNGEMLCQRECLNGFDCGREGYTCVEIDARQMLNLCRPSCTDETCGACGRCNRHTGRCEARTAPVSMGNDIGAACTRSGEGSECRSGSCITERNATNVATGFNGGYCIALCALPDGWNASSLYDGDRLPPGNCPDGAVCFPNGNEISERSEGVCLQSCESSADCREDLGYYCRKSFRVGSGRRTFENGFCDRIDCAQSGISCPDGLTCERRQLRQGTMTVTIGYCVRPAG